MDQTAQPESSLSGGEKPLPRDMSHHFSHMTWNRKPNPMKAFYKFFSIPGIGNFAGGLPNVSYFPFDTLEAQTAKPERWTPTLNDPSDPNATAESPRGWGAAAPAHITVPKSAAGPDPMKKIDLATALQYGLAQGYPPLLSWVRQFTREHLHPNVPYRDGPEVLLTVGSTDGFSKTVELLINPWSEHRGDDPRDRPGVLCERFAYCPALGQAQAKGAQVVAVNADSGGMCVDGPGGLEDVLANWDESKGRRPHLMYTVTMGHNPTGIVLSVERRKAIYEVCCKYDVIIAEDDPYWYMQFPSAEIEEAKSRGKPAPETRPAYQPEKSSGFPFLDSMVPSFLNFDVEGRVIRLDTFSKTVAPGCRLGWVTAQPAIAQKLITISEGTTQQPSGFVQSMISELVMGSQPQASTLAWLSLRTNAERAAFRGWQMDGWVRWLAGLRGEYERRMNRVCRILDEGSVQIKQSTAIVRSNSNGSSSSDGGSSSRSPGRRLLGPEWGVITKKPLFEFDWPRGGMFVWLRVLFESHPLWGAPRKGKQDEPAAGVMDGPALSGALLMLLTRRPYLAVVSPGVIFSADADVAKKDAWAYYRICFAAEADERIEPLSHAFVEGVQRFFRIKTVQEVEDLLEDFPFAAAGVQAALDGADEAAGNLGMYMGC
ncbi:hypothetical protein RB594_001795 [Gaeumannomyces avenae]